MTGKAPKSLADLLEGGKLGSLGAEARRRRDLTEQIRALLPADIAPHLLTANIAATDELVLTMDASAWAARVRYLEEQIGGKRRVKVRVRPAG
jgi:hypothetical protein